MKIFRIAFTICICAIILGHNIPALAQTESEQPVSTSTPSDSDQPDSTTPEATQPESSPTGQAQIAVRTSKLSYQFSQPIDVIVSAINLTESPITLDFNSGCQAEIEIDDIYNNELFPHFCTQVLTSVILEPWQAHEWRFEVTPDSSEYPPIYPGEHEIKAFLKGYDAIATTTFHVGYSATGIGQLCGGSQITQCPDTLECNYEDDSLGANGYCIPGEDYISPDTGNNNTETPPIRETVLFKDLYSDHWAVTYIKKLVELNILQGYEDGTFRQDSPVTRAELVKMSLSSAKILPTTSKIVNCEREDLDYCTGLFNDLAEWQEPWVFKAQELGIVNGYDETTFGPDKPVTRAEAIKILLLSFDTAPDDLELAKETPIKNFPDVNYETDWFGKYVAYMANKLFISGYSDGTFGPHNNMTRAEASKLIYLLMYNA